MKQKKRQCCFCKRWFMPDKRNKHQRVCFRKLCRKRRKRREGRRWVLRNKAQKRIKLRVWAKSYPNYWRHYRKAHPEYLKKDNKRRVKAQRRARCSAK